MTRRSYRTPSLRPAPIAVAAAIALALGAAHLLRGQAFAPVVAPSGAGEEERAFFEDGPARLLAEAERARVAALPAAERAKFIADFLARDPIPETPENELAQGIARRRRLVANDGVSFADARGALLFLKGAPTYRNTVHCGEVFKPIEIWRYGGPEARPIILFQPEAAEFFHAWLPTDSKRALYIPEMEYFLEQFEELKGRISGERVDLRYCKAARELDKASGVSGLFGFERDRMTDLEVKAAFAPPPDLAAWARAAASTPLAGVPEELPVTSIDFDFPERRGERLLVRGRIVLPAGVALGIATEGENREARLALDGGVERQGRPFDSFRNRFVLPPPKPGDPVAILFERPLRPNERFVVRLTLRDEVSGKTAWISRALAVPAEPRIDASFSIAVKGAELGVARSVERDSLILLPPPTDVVFGLFRTEAIVVGDRIRKVSFFLDGKLQQTRGAAPWSVELKLPNLPQEFLVRAEGYDAEGQLVAADELALSEPQGEARVRILYPQRGKRVSGHVVARAAIVVPSERRIQSVEFKLNDKLLAKLEKPPWEAGFDALPPEMTAFLTVDATYDDASQAEDVRILGGAGFGEELQVDLVELYTTVVDRDSRPVEGLAQEAFSVLEDAKPRPIARFEAVENRPITVGILIDTSGSMRESIGEAKRAAVEFLRTVIKPSDRCFAVAFSGSANLIQPPTPDVHAVEIALRDVTAYGDTALHDALLYALYQMKGVRGRKALVLLSDGDDNSSLVRYEDALEFARRNGAVIYTIGLDISSTELSIRSKLKRLSEETGGRVFFVSKAIELAGVYTQIERELRSQYLIAFSPPDDHAPEGSFHGVEVKMKDSKLKARTIRGYYR